MKPRYQAAAFVAFALCLHSVAPGQVVNPNAPPIASASPTDEEIVHLNAFDVSAQGDHGYNTTNTTGATKVNTPILDTSTSIVTLNTQLMKDVAATDPVDAAVYVSGVAAVANVGSGQITVRGENISGANIRDGIPDPLVSNGNIFQDVALDDRIEIVKGPAGVLYGDYSAYGGLVNLVTKQPQATPMNSLSLSAGADEFGGFVTRSVLDMTGPLTPDKTLQFRLIVVGAQGKTLQGGADSTFIVSPELKYDFAGGGSLQVRFAYQNPHRGTNEYSWFIDAAGVISTFINPKQSIPDLDAGRNTKILNTDIIFNQPFKTGPIQWDSRFFFRWDHLNNLEHLYEQAPTTFNFMNAQGVSIGNITNTTFANPNWSYIEITPRTRTTFIDYQQYATGNYDMVGKFDTGPVKNMLLFYAQDIASEEDNDQYAGNYPATIIYSKIPGLGPVHYNDEVAAQASMGGAKPSNDVETVTSLWAAGAQYNLSLLSDRLFLVAGIRNDRQVQTTANYISNQFIPGDVRKGTTQKYGVVVHPVRDLTLYYNWSESFSPNGFGVDANANSYKLPNLNSLTREEGAKLDLFQDTLTLTGAYFITTVVNALVTIPTTNFLGQEIALSVPAGALVIKGWEFDGTYSLGQNLSAIFGAGNLTSKTATGLAARGVSFGTNYRFLIKYEFSTGGWWRGLFFGPGVIHQGLRAADAADDATMPPYTLTNAFLGWERGHWRYQLNVNNVFNITYTDVGVARQIMYGGLPRTYQGTVQYSW